MSRYITITEFCAFHGVDVQWVETLIEYGIVEPTPREETFIFAETDIEPLEMALRLHRDLEINPPGIDAILHMRGRLEALQREVAELRVRLRQLEDRRKPD